MREPGHCNFCGTEVNLGDRFRYELSTEDWGEAVRELTPILGPPTYVGRPWLICSLCRASIEENNAELSDEREEDLRSRRLFWRILLWASLLAATTLTLAWIAS